MGTPLHTAIRIGRTAAALTCAAAFAAAPVLIVALRAEAVWAREGASTGIAEMARIPAGAIVPLYARSERPGEAPEAVQVPSFLLDKLPVTNADYLAFVRAVPKWRRSAARPVFVDAGYLRHWTADLEPGSTAPAQSPVVSVSWFAARAYCAWQGKRLPATSEWERAALASESAPDGSQDPAFRERILRWYARPAAAVLPAAGSVYRNTWGVFDLHGLVWEWTEDFNTALGTGESRQDSDLERRLFCGSGAVGATGREDYASFMRYSLRGSLSASYTLTSLGFRCAQTPPSGEEVVR